MRLLNNTVKFLCYVGVHLLTIIQCYLMSFVFTAPFVCATLMIINAVTKTLPASIIERFWLFYLVICIPLMLILFIVIELDLIKVLKETKK